MDLNEELPVLVVSEGITYTDDERLLIDGAAVAPGRYRLQLADDGQGMPV
ncbi:hypothetical protein SAMN05216276_10863 [Streptosporangium subroseum]|uniref:Uncharacterized protein n=1 Tax=Streptosporangium subroseum TaxID=106412 RepID=A0A239P465_9ACTN|nr:hypothetical protein [Streptosporangium subroseum]SNT61866.1 hypothetical protein SAMN05216276_10863 [Streptosporangium subroseum]